MRISCQPINVIVILSLGVYTLVYITTNRGELTQVFVEIEVMVMHQDREGHGH